MNFQTLFEDDFNIAYAGVYRYSTQTYHLNWVDTCIKWPKWPMATAEFNTLNGLKNIENQIG